MKKPTFICAVAGPLPAGVAAACLTELNLSRMTYDRFWGAGPEIEVQLAKIPIEPEEGDVTGTPGRNTERRSFFASASGTNGTATPIALLQNQGLADLSFDHYYPPSTSGPEPAPPKIPLRDEETEARAVSPRERGRAPYFAAASGPSGTIATVAILARQGLYDFTYDRFYPATRAPEPDLPKIPLDD